MTQPGPANPQNSLEDPDDVEFRWADDLEPGSGLTPQEVDALLSVPLSAVAPLTAAGSTESLYANDNEGGDAVTDDGLDLDLHDPGIIKISAEAYGSDRRLREYWTHGEGAAKIRWGTPGDFKRCVRHLEKYVTRPEGLCNEYHVEAVGAPPGKGHSVETQSFEVNAADAPVARVGSNNPNAVQWEGVLAVEGVETGDGRMFANGSLTWPQLPIPLMYQYETSHGGNTDRSTNVGNITEAWRDGNKIMGRGTIDLGDEYGVQAARKMKGRYLNGVSIDADSVKDTDIELVFAEPDPAASEVEQVMSQLAANPQLTIFHSGRMRGATLVNLPAFVEASLTLVGDTSALDGGAAMVASGGVRKYIRDKLGRFDDKPGGSSRDITHLPHVGDTSAEPTVQERLAKLTPEERDRYYRRMEGDNPDVISESELPDLGDSEDAKKKRRQYIEGDYGAQVITAAATGGRRGYTIEIPELPPIGFFEEPTDLPPIGAVWIESNGRISGLVGPSGVAHRAFRGKRVTVPMGNVDYTRWMNRPTPVLGYNGEILKIRTGVITMNCGHLMDFSVVDPDERMRHYDNSCSIAAVVRVGESRKHRVPWIAGVIMPMSVADFQRFQACQLSGDWAPHPERRGWKDFVAALAVPVPGFPRSTDVAAVRVDDNAIVVASSVPIRLTEDVYDEVDDEVMIASNRLELGRIRAAVGSSHRQSLADIRRQIHQGAKPLTAAAATAPVKEKKTVGCAPCAAKAARRNGQTSANEPTPQVEGFGQGDGQAAAQRSAENAVANSRGTSRG